MDATELTSQESSAGGRYLSADTKPIPEDERHWGKRHYALLWTSMSQCIPAYLLASGLIAVGMNWVQALLTVALANLLVLIPLVLNSHAGTKYGIGFPVFTRAVYGMRGAHFAGLLRGFVACGWFGIQTWIGGQAIFVIIGQLAGSGWSEAARLGDYPWTQWLCFAVFLLLQLLIVWRGMQTLRRFEVFAAPLLTVTFAALMVWMLIRAGGVGPILSRPSRLGWGAEFWAVFPPSLMSMIAFWATMSLNMPDFSRFAKNQRAQGIGQTLGLPTAMTWISLVSIVVTSASAVVYGVPIWDPVALAARFHNPIAVILGLLVALLGTMSATIASDVVSPAYVFANAAPRYIGFRTGAVITSVIAVVIQPWRLLADPNIYIYTWLGFYGGVVAAVAGVLIAGYWFTARTELSVSDLFRGSGGRYWFHGGWNWRAVLATVLAGVLAVGGAYSEPGKGPFPADGLIPFLRPLYDYSTGIGLVAGLLIAVALTPPKPRK